MMSKFKQGDIVRLKINPEQRVMILAVRDFALEPRRLDGGRAVNCGYLARCMDGNEKLYADFELEEIPDKSQDKAYWTCAKCGLAIYLPSPPRCCGCGADKPELTNANVALKYRLDCE